MFYLPFNGIFWMKINIFPDEPERKLMNNKVPLVLARNRKSIIGLCRTFVPSRRYICMFYSFFYACSIPFFPAFFLCVLVFVFASTNLLRGFSGCELLMVWEIYSWRFYFPPQRCSFAILFVLPFFFRSKLCVCVLGLFFFGPDGL